MEVSKHRKTCLHAAKMSRHKRLEPSTREDFKRDLVVWRILCNNGVDGFLDALNGYNIKWSRQVVDSWDERKVVVDGKRLTFSTELIATTIKMKSVRR